MDCVFFSEPARKVVTGLAFCYDFHGIFIQNSGKAKITIDNRTSNLKKGDFIFLRANQVRVWDWVSKDFSGYLLIFENAFVESFFNDALFIHRFQFFQTNQPAILRSEETFFTEHITNCEKIISELNQLQDDSHHYIRSLLYTILIQLNRKYNEEYKLSSELYQDDISLRFRRFLEKYIRSKQRVEDYASLLNINRSQLNKAIKKTAGKPTSIIIRERLLTEINRDLLYSNRHISEIAYELGFSDNSNFVRFYRTHTGQTPGEFRSNNSK